MSIDRASDAATRAPIEIEFSYSTVDLLVANLHVLPRMRAVQAIVAATFLFFLVANGDEGLGFALFSAAFLTPLVCVAVYLLTSLIIVATKESRAARAVAVDERRVTMRYNGKTISYDWITITGAHRGPRFIYLAVDNGSSMAIPRRALRGPRDEAALLTFAGNRMRGA